MHSLISPKQKKMGAGIKIVGEQNYTDRQSRVGKEQKTGHISFTQWDTTCRSRRLEGVADADRGETGHRS